MVKIVYASTPEQEMEIKKLATDFIRIFFPFIFPMMKFVDLNRQKF